MIWLLFTYLLTVRGEYSGHNFVKGYVGCGAGHDKPTATGTLAVFLTRGSSLLLLYW